MNSLVYLTRKCPRDCGYCNLKKSIGEEMSFEDWRKAFSILKEMGVDFNLILGNETWLLGRNLLGIVNSGPPYALYTTCPRDLFLSLWTTFFKHGEIDNLSCGIDYPIEWCKEHRNNDMEKKSWDGWRGLRTTKMWYPNVDTQGTITVNALNYHFVQDTVLDLYDHDIFCGINFIHYNKDGGFDFFPKKKDMKEFLFDTPEKRRGLKNIISEIADLPNTVQNFEMIKEPIEMFLDMEWHCKGDPYGGPTIDASGALRCCGYRKGKRTSKFHIFDLPERIDDWREAVYADAMDCCGCGWSYPIMYHYWSDHDKEFGRKIFANHAGKHIPESKWSRRNLE